jgi:hypothetical protein
MSKNNGNMSMCVALIAIAATVMATVQATSAGSTTAAESWSVSLSGTVSASQDGANIEASFPASYGFPPIGEARFTADASGNGLVGDFLGAGANSISYNAVVNGSIGSGTRVTLIGGSGLTWYNFVGAANGDISVSLDSPWNVLGAEASAANWAADLSDVIAIGVSVNRGVGTDAQSYAISGFELSSDRGIGSLSGLAQALFNRFGVTSISDLSAADANADSDGDGMSDLNEILAENDPDYYANNLFLADVVSVSSTGVTIEWACVAGASYQIYRADSLTGGGVDKVGGLQTTDQTGYASAVDSGAGSGGFYWVHCTTCD